MCTPKSNVCMVVSRTSVVLFTERTSGSPPPYIHAIDSNVHSSDLAYVHLMKVSVWLLFSKGSKRD
jgi:hypothetical protein